MTESKKNCAEEMFPLVEMYFSSPASQKEFSAEHGISLSVLNYWIAKYRREQAESAAFLEIVPATEVADRPLLEISYPTGVRLRVFSPLAPAYLDRLLSHA
jgi:transposase-like protein